MNSKRLLLVKNLKKKYVNTTKNAFHYDEEEEDEVINEVPVPSTQNSMSISRTVNESNEIENDDYVIATLLEKLKGIQWMIREEINKVVEEDDNDIKENELIQQFKEKRKRKYKQRYFGFIKRRAERRHFLRLRIEIGLKRWSMISLYKNMLCMKYYESCLIKNTHELIENAFLSLKLYSKIKHFKRKGPYNTFFERVLKDTKYHLMIKTYQNTLRHNIIKESLIRVKENTIKVKHYNNKSLRLFFILFKASTKLIKIKREQIQYIHKKYDIKIFFSRAKYNIHNKKKKEYLKSQQSLFPQSKMIQLIRSVAHYYIYLKYQKELLNQKRNHFRKNSMLNYFYKNFILLVGIKTYKYISTHKDTFFQLEYEAKKQQGIVNALQAKYDDLSAKFNSKYKILQKLKEQKESLISTNKVLLERKKTDKIKFEEIYHQNLEDIKSKNFL